MDSLVVSALQDDGGYAISAKITSSCIWVAIPVDWIILHWYACGADGRSLGQAVGRSVYGHLITKFSRMGRLLHFLTHGAPLARFASLRVRELSSFISASLKSIVAVELAAHNRLNKTREFWGLFADFREKYVLEFPSY